MTRKFKNYLKVFILLFGIVFALTNCEKDSLNEYHQTQESTNHAKKVLSINIKEIPTVIDYLVDEQKNYLPKLEINKYHQKSSYVNPFGAINTTIIRALEDFEGNRTYTFKIDSFIEDISVFYNLIVVTDAYANVYKTYIQKYTTYNYEKLGKDYDGKIEKYELNGVYVSEKEIIQGKTTPQPDCVECTDPLGDGNDEDDEDDYNDTGDNDSTNDNNYNDTSGNNNSGESDGSPATGEGSTSNTGTIGGPSNDSGDSSDTGNGDSGDGFTEQDCPWHEELVFVETQSGETTVIIVAYDCNGDIVGSGQKNTKNANPELLPCCDEDVVVIEDVLSFNKDCKKLEKLSNSPSFQERMAELMANNSGNTEIAYWGRNDTNGNMNYLNDSDNRFESQPNVAEIRPSTPTTPVNSLIHNHSFITITNQNGNPQIQKPLSVFSGSDLYTISNMYVNGLLGDLDELVLVVTTPGLSLASTEDDTVYAITINDVEQFENLANILAITPILIDEYYRELKINANFSTNSQEKGLALMFKEKDLGMTLYRGDKNDLTNWTRLTIKNNGDLKERNCN